MTAYLESNPVEKQDDHVLHLEEEINGTSQEQPYLSSRLKEMQGRHPQAQRSLPQRDRREEQQEILPQPGEDEMFFSQAVHNHFKFDHPAAETAGLTCHRMDTVF